MSPPPQQSRPSQPRQKKSRAQKSALIQVHGWIPVRGHCAESAGPSHRLRRPLHPRRGHPRSFLENLRLDGEGCLFGRLQTYLPFFPANSLQHDRTNHLGSSLITSSNRFFAHLADFLLRLDFLLTAQPLDLGNLDHRPSQSRR